ncbi:MAG: CDP-glycerol glycerophosphotransferase family protein [Bacillaceae bacterium]
MNPTLSVIVIAYNNELYVEEALESLASQTYEDLEVIVVNDYSTDRTGELIDSFIKEDNRFKAVHLSKNSGGCSVPRNTGIAHSSGKYIMFLDGDDWYPKEACEKMVHALERTGSDFVCGQVIRTNTYKLWYGDSIYSQERLNFNIREYPQMLFDSLSVNKIYRREFLDKHNLRFLEGIHYEDILFSSMAYFYADHISVIPELMYYWRVVENTNQKSITNRRFEIQNLIDRLKAHKYVDNFLQENHFDIYRASKNNKFLRHDLKLYINDYSLYDEEYKQQFFKYVKEYLTTAIDIYELKRLAEKERILTYFLYVGDREAFEEYFKFVHFQQTAENRLSFINGKCFFKGTIERKTDSSFLELDRTFQAGVYIDDLKLINNEVSMYCKPIIENFGEGTPVYELVFQNRITKQREYFTIQFPNTELTLPSLEIGTYDLYIGVTYGSYHKLIRLSARHVYKLTVKHFVVKKHDIHFYSTKHGNISFKVDAPTDFRKFVHRITKNSAGKSGAGIRGNMKNIMKRLIYKFPVSNNLVYIESHMGKQYSDNPKYIYEEILKQKANLKVVWSFEQPNKHDVPGNPIKVKRGTLKQYYYISRAKYWIDNQGLANQCSKKKDQFYIQTWHGTPLKKMGYDQKNVKLNKKAFAALNKQVSIWDRFISSNDYSTNIFREAFQYEGEILEIGYPRNDVLVHIENEKINILKQKLGIHSDKKVILYVPTFRDWNPISFNQVISDIHTLVKHVREDVILLLRTHYLVSSKLAIQSDNIMDVSNYDDVQQLYLIADALITDYSSVMFDYAVLKRPMLFYVPDYDEYVKERGMYFDLKREAPGPVCENIMELIKAIDNFEQIPVEFNEKKESFEKKFTSLEKGLASKQVADLITNKKLE